MNVVLILTDTQPVSMVGCYSGDAGVGTPNIDRLASRGTRFDRAYTTCPLCTPARAALFSGQHAPVNGAWANSLSPGVAVPLTGRIFAEMGYQTAYSGKWHLDGTGYFGDGHEGGGFSGDWWFDGRNYAEFLGPEAFESYRGCQSSADLKKAGFTRETIWARQVTNRALSFLENARKDAPFLLVVSYDEPHSPYVAPPEYWETEPEELIPVPPNFFAPLDGKPQLQQAMRVGEISPGESRHRRRRQFACNRFLDSEIGRILDVLEDQFDDDTVIIHTSDHGDMHYSHGLTGKGPMMYEEVLRVPLIMRLPGAKENQVRRDLVSHVDLLPSLLEILGTKVPGILHGKSFAPLLTDGREVVGDRMVHCNFSRFALNHDGWGGFYPIRCVVTDRYKLALNLFDQDELYDLDEDPHEMVNRILDPSLVDVRRHLHGVILDEMDRTRDPFRGRPWVRRPWMEDSFVEERPELRRGRPSVFPFQHAAIEGDGVWSRPVTN